MDLGGQGGQDGWSLGGRTQNKKEDVKIYSLGLNSVCVRESPGQERSQQTGLEARLLRVQAGPGAVSLTTSQSANPPPGHRLHMYQLLEVVPQPDALFIFSLSFCFAFLFHLYFLFICLQFH